MSLKQDHINSLFMENFIFSTGDEEMFNTTDKRMVILWFKDHWSGSHETIIYTI
jgi:hypothetical protein